MTLPLHPESLPASAEQLKTARLMVNLTQAQAATLTGVSLRQWQRAEAGTATLNRRSEVMLEMKLGKKLNTLPEGQRTNEPWTAGRIQHLRAANDWSQKELADRLSTTQATVARWEQGRYDPSEHHKQSLDRLEGAHNAND